SYLSLLARLAEMGFRFEDVEVELSDTRVVAHLCSSFGISRNEIRDSVRARDYKSSERLIEKLSGAWPRSVAGRWADLAQFDLPKHLIVQMGLLEQNVCAPLREERNGVCLGFNLRRLTGLVYYEGPCFHIKARNDRGEAFAVADGGFVNWTQRLLG